ncbi:hypothetical protein OE88DRAFT_1805751 [Heliocybe sulcata]|uniref:Uncharacterized protein n=1 Tax=Heliocybe sulcata TaxID=5364 RepID=A0A5C3N9I7_9AGAM|nr:hypothetical protein OE88DRAFT_1805751 [Heliocybe sulcata]
MIFGASMYALVFRQDAFPQRRQLLLVNISLYVLCTMQATFLFWQSFVTTDLLPGGSSGRDPHLVHEVLHFDLAQTIGDVLVPCTNLIADGLLVWRCYVLYNRRISVVIGPVVLLVAGTACGLATAVLQNNQYWIRFHQPVNSTTPPPQWSTLGLQLEKTNSAMYITSAITNASMSGLIALRIWKATRNLGQNKAVYRRIASLLLETGILYSVSLMVSAIFSALNPYATVAISTVLLGMAVQITQQSVGIFPTVIILVVALGKSSDQTVVNSANTKHRNEMQRDRFSTIQFASPPSRSSTATGPTHSIELETRSIVLDAPEKAVKVEEV